MEAMGNAKARAIYEHGLTDSFRRTQNDSAMEQFIRQKYEQRKWIDPDWAKTPKTQQQQVSPSYTQFKREREVQQLDISFLCLAEGLCEEAGRRTGSSKSEQQHRRQVDEYAQSEFGRRADKAGQKGQRRPAAAAEVRSAQSARLWRRKQRNN